jgi:hypothetical protein
MKFTLMKSLSYLSSFVAVAMVSTLPAKAETVALVSETSQTLTSEVASPNISTSDATLATVMSEFQISNLKSEFQTSSTELAQADTIAQAEKPIPAVLETLTVEPTAESSATTSPEAATPVPGTTSQSSSSLTEPDTSSSTGTTSSSGSSNILAQDIEGGRATQSGSSYIGIGGNIGVGDGDTQIGEGAFAIISKIGLTSYLSARPSLLISDGVSILLPITYDFTFGAGPTDELGFSAAPYLGAGAVISTEDDFDIDLLLTGGVDIPLGSQFTATAAVNVSLFGNTAVGVLLGVGYNFSGF